MKSLHFLLIRVLFLSLLIGSASCRLEKRRGREFLDDLLAEDRAFWGRALLRGAPYCLSHSMEMHSMSFEFHSMSMELHSMSTPNDFP